MQRTNHSSFFLLFLVAVSLIGLALVPLLLLQPNLQTEPSPYRVPVISAIYSGICIGGIVAVFYPNKCRVIFQKPSVSLDSKEQKTSELPFKGHHPNCENFANNRISIRGSFYCAACSGLLAGAIASLVGAILFPIGFFSGAGNLWVLAVGEGFMLTGLTQIRIGGYAKVTVNALFVVGSFISLVAADLVGRSLLVDTYMLGLIVFMLWFRILLSEWNNKRTCVTCSRCI